MKLLIKAVLALVMLAIPASVAAYSGIISIDTTEAVPGTRFSVGIYLNNSDEEIGAMILRLKYNSPYVDLDSVSFIGSIVSDEFSKGWLKDPTLPPILKTVSVLVLPRADLDHVPKISAPSGLIARAYFRLLSTAGNSVIAIDSVNHFINLGGGIQLPQNIDMSTSLGTPITPGFRAGAVKVMVSTAAGDDAESSLPTEFALSQNYPNPFNPSSSIEFALPRASYIKLEVFNVLGERVALLVDGRMPAGVHRVEFDGANRPSGIYFYRLLHDGGSETRKMVLLK